MNKQHISKRRAVKAGNTLNEFLGLAAKGAKTPEALEECVKAEKAVRIANDIIYLWNRVPRDIRIRIEEEAEADGISLHSMA